MGKQLSYNLCKKFSNTPVFVHKYVKSNRLKYKCQVAMVEKFPDDSKPNTSLIKMSLHCFNFVNLIHFISFVKMFVKVSGFESERTVSKLEKEKENFCVVYSKKWARENRKFPVAVLQWWLRNVQKNLMHVQSCCFANNIILLLFCHSCCRHRRRCLSYPLLWARNFASMVTWRHTSRPLCCVY